MPHTYKHIEINYLVAQHIFQHLSNHIYNESVKRQTVDTIINWEQRYLWNQSMSNELGILSQGNDTGVKANNCVDFIHHRDLPNDIKVTYANRLLDCQHLKSYQCIICLVVGGDKLDYALDAGSPAASMLETKFLVNSVISDAKEGSRLMICDLKDFFLCTTMDTSQYMQIPYNYFLEDIRIRYNLKEKVSRGFIYVRIKRVMYGLNQAAILTYDQIVKHLKTHGYYPVIGSNEIFSHKTQKTNYVYVDDFGIKYHSTEDADHILNSLKGKYYITTDWEGKNFCGLTLDCNYKADCIYISMPGYVTNALNRLQHTPKLSPQYSSHQHTGFKYCTLETRQYEMAPDETPTLSKQDTTFVKYRVGPFYYYCISLDCTILPVLNETSLQQSKPTQQTKEKCQILMDYLATYPDAYI